MEPSEQYGAVQIDPEDVRQSVVSYLLHNCYKNTLECLLREFGSPKGSELKYIDERKRMY